MTQFTQQPLFSTFKGKLLGVLLLLGILPLLIFGLAVIQINSRVLTQQTEHELEGTAKRLSLEIDTYVNDLLSDAGAIAQLPQLTSGDAEQQVPIITQMFEHYGKYGQLAIIDPSSQILQVAREQELIEISHIDSFQRAAKGEQAWVVAPHLFNPDVLILHMHTPILDSSGNVIQVLGSPSSFNGLVNLISSVEGRMEGDANIFIMDDTGRVFVHTNPEIMASTPNYGAPFGLAADGSLSVTSGAYRYQNEQGVNVVALTERIDDLGWTIVVEGDQSIILQPVNTSRLLVIGGLLLSVAAAVITALLMSNRLTEQIDRLQELFVSIRMGDYAARAEVVSKDELGEVAGELNSVLDILGGLIQTRDERDEIQASISELLAQVSTVAGGDLSISAEIGDNITSDIAKSFNVMIEQLRKIITEVKTSTLQVSSAADEIQTTAEQLASNNEAQASQIVNTSAAIDEMSVSIQQVSENARLSAEVGEQARAQAHRGTMAVQNTIEGMERIRVQVQDTSKRIKRLSESSQEIGDIVTLIRSVADRISILALNASIQASRAGEAGRGFAVVAEEVERLSEMSTNAAKDISGRVSTIQQEMKEVSSSMDTTIGEVVNGAYLANEAGQTLVEIGDVSTRLSDLIQSISQATVQQARGSETIAHSMNDIAGVTQQTAAGTKQAAVAISNLATLADELRSSVSTFKLSQNGHAVHE